MSSELTSPLFPDIHPMSVTTGCIPDLHDLIEKRAYELFEKSGRRGDLELEHWLAAERAIKHHLGI